MIRRINYTGRLKLKLAHIHIEIIENDNGKSFDAEIDFSEYTLPSHAKVYLEPYYRLSFMRFDCGTVGYFSLPQDTLLKDLPDSDIIYFRVKIVDETENVGKLVAFANNVKPLGLDKGEISSKSIKPVDYRIDLGQQVWKLSLEEAVPVLLINSRIKDGRTLVQSHEFYSLVLPAVVREIMTEIIQDHSGEDPDSEHWSSLWLGYVTKVLRTSGIPEPESSIENQKDWIEDVVKAFCDRNRILKNHFKRTNIVE
ncbi:MAG: hypothetical protein GX126_11370 [Bacteroidales bacterium]|jgi:hypothetical protein|nr:hypothetical protein [Bacteroidales bacterium]